MNHGLNKKVVQTDYNQEMGPANIGKLKAQIDRGYEIARKKHPELPRTLTTFKQRAAAEVAECRQKKARGDGKLKNL